MVNVTAYGPSGINFFDILPAPEGLKILEASDTEVVIGINSNFVLRVGGTDLAVDPANPYRWNSGTVTSIRIEDTRDGSGINIAGIDMLATDFDGYLPDPLYFPDFGIDLVRSLLWENDHYLGGDGHDVIFTSVGDDTVSSGAGNDDIYVGPGAAAIDGGEGDDYVIFAEDFVFYPPTEGGVIVNLAEDTGTSIDGGLLSITGVENVIGSYGDDVIIGNDGSNWLAGDVGDDEIYGGGGADTLQAGLGSDTLDGGDGDDRFEIGETFFNPYPFNTSIIGGAGNDVADFIGILTRFSFRINDDASLVFTQKTTDVSYTLSGVEFIYDGVTYHSVEDFREVNLAAQTVSEDGSWSYKLPEGAYREGTTFTVTDLDGKQLPSWISFNVETRTFSGTPPADFNGTIGIKVSANDLGIPKVSTFSLNVVAANDAPAGLRLTSGWVWENTENNKPVGVLHAKDAEGDDLTFSLLDDAGGRFKIDGNKLVVADGAKLDYEQAMSHTVTVKVSDKLGASSTQQFTVNVRDVAKEKVTGSTGSDTVKGGSGSDKIGGGLGKDVLTGGKGKDAFVFNTKASKTNVDTIKDFSVKDDSIQLDNKFFAKLGKKGTESKPAKLDKEFFTIGSKAKEKDDYVVYDSKKGKLYYDGDGSGKGKAVEVANLSKKLKMTADDFFVI